MRRAFRDISSILILSGLLLLIDGAVTVFWQEPVTAAIGAIQRADVNKEYLSYKTAPLTGTQNKALKSLKSPREKIRYLALARTSPGSRPATRSA